MFPSPAGPILKSWNIDPWSSPKNGPFSDRYEDPWCLPVSALGDFWWPGSGLVSTPWTSNGPSPRRSWGSGDVWRAPINPWVFSNSKSFQQQVTVDLPGSSYCTFYTRKRLGFGQPRPIIMYPKSDMLANCWPIYYSILFPYPSAHLMRQNKKNIGPEVVSVVSLKMWESYGIMYIFTCLLNVCFMSTLKFYKPMRCFPLFPIQNRSAEAPQSVIFRSRRAPEESLLVFPQWPGPLGEP